MAKRRSTNPLDKLKKLTPLDIRACRTLGQLVAGLKNCAFGANMLGSVVETFTRWVEDDVNLPVVVYDGPRGDDRLWFLLEERMLGQSIGRILTSQEFFEGVLVQGEKKRNVLVVGPYMRRYEAALHAHPTDQILYVNKERMCTPGMARDGSFTNVCFSDPGVVLEIMHAVERERHGASSVDPVEFMRALGRHDGVGRAAADAFIVQHKMFTARRCRVMLTLSGAMTAAQLGAIPRVMMEQGWTHGIVATGALMAHGLVEGLGLAHLMHDPAIPDLELVKWGGNRITTVVEPEVNFDVIDEVVSAILSQISGKRPISPSQLLRKIGLYLNRKYPKNKSILGTAARMNIPVFVPAFYDSELGNDVTVANHLRRRRGLPRIIIDQEADNRLLIAHSLGARKLGIFTVGGGVPRNWAQNLGPLVNLHNNRARTGYNPCKYAYAVRIDPAPIHYANLSGCTYDEGTAWGKFIAKLAKAEIGDDATIIWPLLMWAELNRPPANDQGRQLNRAA